MGKPTKKYYERNCPRCDDLIVYKSYSGVYNANKNNTNCTQCTIEVAAKKRSKTWAKRRKERGPVEYSKNCPRCGEKQIYSSRTSLANAKKADSMCMECAKLHVSERITEMYASGELVSNGKGEVSSPDSEHFRHCPRCNERIGYCSKYSRNRADKNNSLCQSCVMYEYNRTWNDVIDEDAIKKMRARKAGYDTWEEYEKKYPEKQFYKREVWRLTYQNDLESLPNWDKRGLCGVKGAYQLDHIVSINEGYENNIDPEEIAAMENLRMIPWKENRTKGA